MPANVAVTGYASDYRTPSIGIELVFAQGENISGAGTREILVVAPKSSAGTWTAGTVYGPIKAEQDVITGGGVGSPAHRMAQKIMQANKLATIYVLVVAETSGGSPVKATGTLAWGGTATSSFNYTFSVGDEDFSVYIKSGDAAATVGAAIKATVNGRLSLPFTDEGTGATNTLTNKLAGTRGGTATWSPNRIVAPAPGNGLTLTASAAIGIATAGADGSTTEASNVTAALQSVEGRHFYYYVYDDGNNATALAAIKSHLANKALPRYGRRSYLITGHNGTLAAATTIANGLNYERQEIAFQPMGDATPDHLAAQLVATEQLVRDADPANGLINYSGPDWNIRAARTQYWPDEDDINDAIAAGLSCVASKVGGTYLVMSITTRSKDGSGTYADFRAAESHRISVGDACAQDLTNKMAGKLGKGFIAHPKGKDGLPNPNAKIPPNCVTDFTLKPTFTDSISEWAKSGWTQRVSDSQNSLLVVKSPVNAGRLEASLSIYARDNLSQVTVRMAESSAA